MTGPPATDDHSPPLSRPPSCNPTPPGGSVPVMPPADSVGPVGCRNITRTIPVLSEFLTAAMRNPLLPQEKTLAICDVVLFKQNWNLRKKEKTRYDT